MSSFGPDTRPSRVTLRPYQLRAIDTLDARVRAGARRVLLVAPTGAGKCVTRETLVWSDGLRRFGETWGATRIGGPWGAAVVNGWYDDGPRDGFEVTLRSGVTIDGTPAHRVWVRDRSGFEGWRRLGELRVGDFVAMARGQADFGQREIPLDEAYALGLVIADGCTRGSTLQIDKQVPVLEAVRPVVERWHALGGSVGRPSLLQHRSPRHAVLTSNGPFRALFADRYGIDWQYSENRCVPPAVTRGTREVVRAFLRGYFDGDGYCDRRAAVSTASARLAEEVQQLLLGLGVVASRRRKETVGLPAFVVEVCDADAFAREVGFTSYGLTKDRAFARLLEAKRNTNVDTVPGVGGLLRRASALVPRHSLRRDAWRHVAAYYDGAKLPSYATLADLLPALPPSPERGDLGRIVGEHRFWSPVTEVAASQRRRIDCEVEGQHAFVGNGIVNHNTVISASIVGTAAASRKSVLFLAHRRELIQQTYRKLVDAGVPESTVGVIMANDPRRRPAAPIQIASVDTLRVRAKPPADVVFVDEAHRAEAQTYKAIGSSYPAALHIGLTATPYRADGKGLGGSYDELIVVASPRELIAEGFLTEPRVLTVPPSALPDLTSVRVRGGDYDDKALGDAVNQRSLVGNIVEHWLRHANGVRTVAFAVSIAHSRHIVERFREAGIAAEHLDGATPTPDRDAILARLERGETRVVGSVGTLCEGWDMPSVKCAILARPTKSTGLYLQQAGRILRPWEGVRALILDHAGCAVEHGLPQDDRTFTLDSVDKKAQQKRKPAARAKTCPACFVVLPLGTAVCPVCAASLAGATAPLPETEDALVEATPTLTVHPAPGARGPKVAPSPNVFRTLQSAARAGGRLGWEAFDVSQ